MLDGDGNPAPPQNGTQPPILAHVLRQNGCVDQDATWYGVSLGPGHIVLHGDPCSPLKRGTAAPQFSAHVPWNPPIPKGYIPNFRPMSVVTKRLNISRCHLVLGREIDVGPGENVLDADPAPF